MPRIDREQAWRWSLLLALLLLIVVYLWWREHPQAQLPPPGATQAISRTPLPASADLAAVVNLRLSRDQTQSRSLAELTQIAEVAQSSQSRQVAGDQAADLTRVMRVEQETDAELASRDYQAATVIASGRAEVTLANVHLSLRQVVEIASTVETVTGLPPEAIRIVPGG
jgi:hypothetical protein